MSNDTTRRRAAILKLRRRINLDEAPYLAMEELDGPYRDVLALLVEAVIENDLPADVEPQINQWTGERIGAVEPSRTTIATADLLKWLSTLPRQGVTQPAPEPLDAAPEPEFSCGGDDQGEQEAPTVKDVDADGDADIAGLFDPVAFAQLETMFPADGKWARYANDAVRNRLIAARVGRGMFNPYLAARWWMNTHGPAGWDWSKCLRKLASNLPLRSRDSKHLLTGDLD